MPVWKCWCSAVGDAQAMSDALCLSSSALPGGMRVGKQGMLHSNGDAFRFGTSTAMPLSGCLWVNFRI